jgi:protein-L-isoaspartate(D-aspartate) O-methyltransferase
MTNNLTNLNFQEKKQNTLCILNGIAVYNKKIYDALLDIPRDLFFPDGWKINKYIDTNIVIHKDRTILSLSTIIKTLSILNIKENGSALTIGCGTGYLAAILSKLYANVFAIEQEEQLLSKAKESFSLLSIDNIIVYNSNLSKGAEKQSPYDLIFIEGGTEEIPSILFDQLAVGGQLVTYIPTSQNIGRMVLYQKEGTFWRQKTILETWLPTLKEFKTIEKFVF